MNLRKWESNSHGYMLKHNANQRSCIAYHKQLYYDATKEIPVSENLAVLDLNFASP